MCKLLKLIQKKKKQNKKTLAFYGAPELLFLSLEVEIISYVVDNTCSVITKVHFWALDY